MQAVILAGGLGTRISEESVFKPKPMIEIGGMPILWHIMKIYSSFGVNNFVICCGYKGYLIKEYFSNYFLHKSNVTINLVDQSLEVHNTESEPWKITIIDTGQDTMTGGRLKRVAKYITNDEFHFTYGDGVANVDLNALTSLHRKKNKLATVTAVRPPGRFGQLKINDALVESFAEKPDGDGGLINGGFFILNKKVISLIEGDKTIWEREPLEKLAAESNLAVYQHEGFWQPMDTLRDKNLLEDLWSSSAPWKNWL